MIVSIIWILGMLMGQNSEIPEGFYLVTRDNCGEPGEQSHLIEGQNWKFSASEIEDDLLPLDSPLRTVAHDNRVVFRINGLYKDAVYKVRVSYLSDATKRVQRFRINSKVIQERIDVPNKKSADYVVDVPTDLYQDGQIDLIFEKIEGPNAVVSVIELWSDRRELYPDMVVEVSGDFNGNLAGEIQDINANMPMTSIDVQAIIGEKQVGITQTDQTGKFTLAVDKQGWKMEADFILVRALKDNLHSEYSIAKSEVFLTPLHFTPVPKKVSGVKNTQVNLNGKWYFNNQPAPGFWKQQSPDLSQWSPIQVPGEWVMQGFEVEPNSYAGYYRLFQVPDDWYQKRIILRCDAVYSEAKIYVNQKAVGEHQGGFTPFEFEITDLIEPGEENQIALLVKNETLADTLASGTQYAAHQMGGITRKIFLFAKPLTLINKLYVNMALDKHYQDARLEVVCGIDHFDRSVKNNLNLKFQLEDPQGQIVKVQVQGDIPVEEREYLKFEIPVKNIKKWEVEHPNLYTLTMMLMNGDKTMESLTQKIGFREVEVRGNQVFVNGKSIKLKGINRHEVHPVLGRSLNKDLWRKDAELFRSANMNYIRTSHYPPAEEFIAYCDSLGLFVELEAPFVWIGHNANSTWKKRSPQAAALSQQLNQGILETIRYYHNHPSVIIWSMANESIWTRNWDKAADLANIIDPSRPKSFHDQAWGGYNNYGSLRMPVANIHYPGPEGPELAKDFNRPIIFGEYCHLNTYNRQEIITDPGVRDYYGFALKPMWDNMYKSQGCLGGAIWSGIDDVFELPSGKAIGYGEWGPIDGWRRKKPEYWHVKKVYSPIHILSKKIEFSEDPREWVLKVENRYTYTNLNELDIKWEAGKQQGKCEVDIAPGEEGLLYIKAKDRVDEGQLLNLIFEDRRGFMVDRFEFPLGNRKKTSEQSAAPGKNNLQIITTSDHLLIKGTKVRWKIDKQSGKIVEAIKNGKKIIHAGPRLMMLPLISGPCSTEHSREIAPFNDRCSNWVAQSVKPSQDKTGIKILIEGSYQEAEGSYTYHFSGDGDLTIKYNFKSKIEVQPRQIGIVMDLGKEYQKLEWDRESLWSYYPQDHIGRTRGVAVAFPESAGEIKDFRQEPKKGWAYDYHPMGCNDFRATRKSIYFAQLSEKDGHGLQIFSNGKQHIRAWISDNISHLLIAEYDTGGADIFLARHYDAERKKIQPGSEIVGEVNLRLTD